MNPSLKQVLLVCVCLFALNGQAIADSLSDAANAYVAGNYAKAEKLLRPLAEHGDAKAQWMLGHMYDDGNGVPQNYKEAEKWYRLAAEQNDDSAQLNLGTMYENGKGVPQDYKEAVKWYRLAAVQGNSLTNSAAQWALGTMYIKGKGVPQDYVLSHMWLNIGISNADSKMLQESGEILNSLEKFMTANQIAEAQELARKCTANKFKGC